MRYGGFWVRVAAALIDGFVLLIMLIPTIVIFELFGFFNDEITNYDDVSGPSFTLNLVPQIIWLLILWLYEATMTSSKYQATVGKLCLGLIVVDYQERPLTFMRATVRYFAKYVSCFAFGFGYLMVAFNEHKRGLHDFAANTYVLVKAAVQHEEEEHQKEVDAKLRGTS